MMRRRTRTLGIIFAVLLFGLSWGARAADKEEKRSPLKQRRPLILKSLEKPAETYNVYIGTYTGSGSKGIYVCRFNVRTGEIGEP